MIVFSLKNIVILQIVYPFAYAHNIVHVGCMSVESVHKPKQLEASVLSGHHSKIKKYKKAVRLKRSLSCLTNMIGQWLGRVRGHRRWST